MIPNHKQFIEAVKKKNKVCLRFYSKADSGVIDLVCAPLDYGPGPGAQDGVNRYWFWDYTRNTGSPTLGLLPEQVLDVRVLGELFDSAEFSAAQPVESTLRDVKAAAASGTATPPVEPVQPELNLNSSQASRLVNN